jgi:hypothetical protein
MGKLRAGQTRRRGSMSARSALGLLMLGLALIPALLAPPQVAAQSRPAAVAVFPSPGSKLAPPKAQIAFRGLAPASLGPITVTGSKSGVHTGQIESDSDGQGASFLPASPFTPGETITVTTSLNILGGKGGSFQFQVATPAPLPNGQSLRVRSVPGGVWGFRSRPDLAPPAVEISHGAGAGGGSDLFLTPQYGPVQNGPEILDPGGQLIWFDPVPRGTLAANLQVQSYQGQPVLTWWQGVSAAGIGIGEDVIFDSSYRPVAVVKAANGLNADLHEFQITPSNTAFLTAYFPVIWDARSVHGERREIVFDSVIQEIDIPTGLVLFQWDSLDHARLSESYQPPPGEGPKVGFRNPYDYFHVNSIQLDGDGNLLVSARNTWAVYKVDHHSGRVMWRLGGKRSNFRMLGDASFAFQHDIRSHSAGDHFVTIFDDGAGLPIVHKQSRALELYLDFNHWQAHVYKQWFHAPALSSWFEGNVQQLPDHDEFVGWGQDPFFTEFDQHGHTVLDGRFVSNTASYRAYRFLWTGIPATPPAVAASRTGNEITWYVSWNGATAVSSWSLSAGASPSALRPVARARKTSFETAITAPKQPYEQIQALDSRGRPLGPVVTIHVR